MLFECCLIKSFTEYKTKAYKDKLVLLLFKNQNRHPQKPSLAECVELGQRVRKLALAKTCRHSIYLCLADGRCMKTLMLCNLDVK